VRDAPSIASALTSAAAAVLLFVRLSAAVIAIDTAVVIAAVTASGERPLEPR
jgi:hypothetical protein